MGRSGLITSLVFDVSPPVPFMSFGQIDVMAQGSALGSLVPNQDKAIALCGSPH